MLDQVPEHAASSYGGELQRVADEHDTPVQVVGERGEVGELRRGQHSRFVDDDGGAGGQEVARVGDAAGLRVLDEELVDSVRGDAGLLAKHLGGSG